MLQSHQIPNKTPISILKNKKHTKNKNFQLLKINKSLFLPFLSRLLKQIKEILERKTPQKLHIQNIIQKLHSVNSNERNVRNIIKILNFGAFIQQSTNPCSEIVRSSLLQRLPHSESALRLELELKFISNKELTLRAILSILYLLNLFDCSPQYRANSSNSSNVIRPSLSLSSTKRFPMWAIFTMKSSGGSILRTSERTRYFLLFSFLTLKDHLDCLKHDRGNSFGRPWWFKSSKILVSMLTPRIALLGTPCSQHSALLGCFPFRLFFLFFWN